MQRVFNTAVAALLSVLAGTSAHALTVDFVDGIWNHSCGGGTTGSTGWNSSFTCGSITDGTLTATLNMSFQGTASPHSGNAANIDTDAFSGFLMGNVSASDDGNSGTSLSNYQQWLFTFNRAAVIRDLVVNDIDEGGWRDSVGVETFTGSFLGAGNAANADLPVTVGSKLQREDEFGMTYYRASVNGNTRLDATSQIEGNTAGAVDGFAIYLFNTGTAGGNGSEHGVGLGATFEVNLPDASPVPLPASVLLLLGGVLGLGGLSRLSGRAKA